MKGSIKVLENELITLKELIDMNLETVRYYRREQRAIEDAIKALRKRVK